ncbi:MAG: GntR family transcriptional regulator [Hyphomicrobiaceae bacterium]
MASGKNTSERVYDTIRNMAIDYEFRPDENINESLLAAQLGVSRTPVRDALNKLINEGLIVFRSNRGFFCRSLSADELLHLAEVRLGLEKLALELALARGTDQQRKDLLQFWSDVDARIPSLTTREIARLDEQFHERIFQMTENTILLGMIQQINARVRFVRQIDIEQPMRKGADFKEHFNIARALIERKDKEAMEALTRHLTFTADDAVKALREGLVRIFLKDSRSLDRQFGREVTPSA